MTLDEVCREIVRQWPQWEAEAGQTAQVEQDPEASVAELVERLKAVIGPLVAPACAQVVCGCRGMKLLMPLTKGKPNAQS